MAMLKHAIETIYVSQQQQMVDVTTAAQRSDRIEGVIERDRTITRAELQKLNSEMPVRVNGAVDILIQPYVAQVAKMQAYLEQLDKDRPVEGVTGGVLQAPRRQHRGDEGQDQSIQRPHRRPDRCSPRRCYLSSTRCISIDA